MKYLYPENEQAIKNRMLISQDEIEELFEIWEKESFEKPLENIVPVIVIGIVFLILGLFLIIITIPDILPWDGMSSATLVMMIMLVTGGLCTFQGFQILKFSYYFCTHSREELRERQKRDLYHKFLKQGRVIKGRVTNIYRYDESRRRIFYDFADKRRRGSYITRSPVHLQLYDEIAVLYVDLRVYKSILL